MFSFFIPPTHQSIVGINITPRTITCSWIEPHKQKPYELKAYKHMLLEVHAKTSLILFNPTRMRSLIHTFLSLHKLRNAYVVISLSGEGLVEKQMMLSRPTADLQKIEASDQFMWHYYCLQENPGPTAAPWYCCGILRTLLFQYQLLAIQCQMNVIHITTPTMALLKAYNFLKKAGAQSADKKTNILDYINLNEHIRIRSPHEHAAIVESFGLFLLGQQYHEEH